MIRLFEKSDWAKVADPVEPNVVAGCDLSVFDRGIGITVEDDNGILGCGGVVLHDSENGEIWLRLSKTASPLSSVVGMKAGLKILSNSFPDVRLFCRIQDSFKKGHKLVGLLGFTKDHLDDNYWVYTWQ